MQKKKEVKGIPVWIIALVLIAIVATALAANHWFYSNVIELTVREPTVEFNIGLTSVNITLGESMTLIGSLRVNG